MRFVVGAAFLIAVLLAERYASRPGTPRQDGRRIARHLALYGLAMLVLKVWITWAALPLVVWALPELSWMNALRLSPVTRIVVGVLILDLWTYVLHRLSHGVPLLWRAHRVHHSDPAVDSTTSLRMHPAEFMFTGFGSVAVIVLLDLPLAAVVWKESLQTFAGIFEHSTLNLPPRIDHAISYVIASPYTHRIHHSRDVRQTDSNFGTIFTFWDRIFGTFQYDIQQPFIQTGLRNFDQSERQSLKGMLVAPFQTIASEPRIAERTL